MTQPENNVSHWDVVLAEVKRDLHELAYDTRRFRWRRYRRPVFVTAMRALSIIKILERREPQ